jgi:hypothetical protein
MEAAQSFRTLTKLPKCCRDEAIAGHLGAGQHFFHSSPNYAPRPVFFSPNAVRST